jgi:DNA-directed RNA polymerase subunit RPC12/RpoP
VRKRPFHRLRVHGTHPYHPRKPPKAVVETKFRCTRKECGCVWFVEFHTPIRKTAYIQKRKGYRCPDCGFGWTCHGVLGPEPEIVGRPVRAVKVVAAPAKKRRKARPKKPRPRGRHKKPQGRARLTILRLLHRHPGIAVRALCRAAGWKTANGDECTSKAYRVLRDMEKENLVTKEDGTWKPVHSGDVVTRPLTRGHVEEVGSSAGAQA